MAVWPKRLSEGDDRLYITDLDRCGIAYNRHIKTGYAHLIINHFIGIKIMFSLEAYKTLIESIVRTMDNNSIEVRSGSVRLAYSGRGMYGMTCLGIVMGRHDMDSWRFDMAENIADEISDSGDKDTIALFKKFKECVKGPDRDSMGLSQIEYFPSLTVPAEYHDELTEIIKQFIYED